MTQANQYQCDTCGSIDPAEWSTHQEAFPDHYAGPLVVTLNSASEPPATDAVAPVESTQVSVGTMEKVLVGGDLKELTPRERVLYYRRVCESVGLNPFTKPFQYIVLNGKLTLYAAKDCTEQLRANHGISITSLEGAFHEDSEGLYVVTVKAVNKAGRTDMASGAVDMPDSLKGEARANAIMKAETKAKRRVTLSLSGLGWLDESETDSIPGAQIVEMNDEA